MTFQMCFVAVDRAIGPMTNMATMGRGSCTAVAFFRRQMATLHVELQQFSLVRGIGAGSRAGEQVWSRVDLLLVSGQPLHCLKLSVITGLTFQPFYAAAVTPDEAVNRGIRRRRVYLLAVLLPIVKYKLGGLEGREVAQITAVWTPVYKNYLPNKQRYKSHNKLG
jgi:hypothetical protein